MKTSLRFNAILSAAVLAPSLLQAESRTMPLENYSVHSFLDAAHALRVPTIPGAIVKVADTGFAPIAKKVMPGVVYITILGSPARGSEIIDSGSGFIIASDGYIVTNNHVLGAGGQLRVKLHDKREFTGNRVGIDPLTDLAVIKIDAQDLPNLEWGDSDQLEQGEYVLAFGSPLGLEWSMTLGIASAVHRTRLGINDYEDFIQTDAAISPGSSGGPLTDDKGRVVGINSDTAAGPGIEGIHLSISQKMAQPIIERLIKDGKMPARGFLGLHIADLNETLAEEYKTTVSHGIVVTGVVEGSPAEAAGFKSGDVVVNFNGTPCADFEKFRDQIGATAVGTTINLSILRDGKPLNIKVVLTERPQKS